ncbi:MAG TPA: alpha/beta hydrolase, partial [Gemmatimonadaceae bacterium]|nr:alpha/beta hydrolase [Gemmatimonadaceae bacterium]
VATGCQSPRQIPPTSGVIPVNGVSLPYVIEGTGRPCMVLGSRVYYPRTFSARFKSTLQCAYIDHRGFVADAPAPPGGRFTVDAAVEEFEAARRTLKMDRVVIVGHSVNGLMALAYALRYPEHVSHVIAIGAVPALGRDVNQRISEFWMSRASAGRKAADRRNRARLSPDSLAKLSPSDAFIATYVRNAARYWADSTYDGSWLWQGVTVNMPRVSELFDPARGYTLRAAAPVMVPVLIALGRQDYAVPFTEWEGFRGPFRDVTIEIFERSGHTPQLEESIEFDRRVLGWLQRK